MKKIFTVIALFYLGLNFAQETGSIAGTLLDKEANNQPLPFANIVIVGTTLGTSTDFDGKYEINNVPPGTHTLEFSFNGYKTLRIPNVVVEPDKVIVIDTGLSATTAELEEVVIKVQTSREREEALLLEQKNAVEIKQSIGAQELARKGVSNAESAVTKITGVTKQEGEKNVFVRGLGDRYNSTTLNGLPLPSDNPTYKNITLDFFTSDIIKTVGVSKVFNSNLYGDVAGANIDIESKELNGRQQIKLAISSGINTVTVDEDNFLTTDGSNGLGFGLNSESPITSLDQYDFDNNLNPDSQSTQFNSSVAISGGRRFNIGEDKLSLFLVGGIDNSYQYKEGFARQINATGGLGRDLDVDQYEYSVSQLLMGNFKYTFGESRNTIAFNTIYIHDNNQNVSEYFGLQTSVSDDEERPTFIRRQQTNDNNLFINQLLAEFKITKKLTADIAGSFNIARSDEPDRRQNTFLRIDDEFRVASGSAGLNHRFFSELKEDDIAGRAILTYDLNNASNEYSDEEDKINIIKAGLNYRNTDRQFDFIQFNQDFFSQTPIDRNNPDAVFNQESIDNNTFRVLTDRGTGTNALDPFFYKGKRTILSPFAATTLSFFDKITLNVGVRLDNVKQTVNYDTELISSVSAPPTGPEGNIEKNYILPSLSLKYNFTENSILRLAGSKTYTLPQFIEVAPFLYEDVNFSRFGNPLLQASDDYNVDLKFEWYPKSGEIIAITGFFKYIDFPINTIEVNSAGNDISFVNTPEATAFGAELEIKKNIFSSESGENNLNKLSAGLNISYLNTNQTLEDVETDELTVRYTNSEDKLSGASDLLINADLTYNIKRKSYDFLTSLVFSYFSDRILTIGVAGRENIVETGIPTLDFVNKIKLGENFGVSISAKNLLNPDFTLTQDTTSGDTVELSSYKKGINISAGISYEF